MSHISNVNQSQPLSQISSQSAPPQAEKTTYSSPFTPEKVKTKRQKNLEALARKAEGLSKKPTPQTSGQPQVLSEAQQVASGNLEKMGAVLDPKPVVVNSKGPTLGEKTSNVLRKMVGAGAIAGTYFGLIARELIKDGLKNQSLVEMGMGFLTGIIALPFRILFAIPVYLQQKGYGV